MRSSSASARSTAAMRSGLRVTWLSGWPFSILGNSSATRRLWCTTVPAASSASAAVGMASTTARQPLRSSPRVPSVRVDRPVPDSASISTVESSGQNAAAANSSGDARDRRQRVDRVEQQQHGKYGGRRRERHPARRHTPFGAEPEQRAPGFELVLARRPAIAQIRANGHLFSALLWAAWSAAVVVDNRLCPAFQTGAQGRAKATPRNANT